MDGYFSIHRQIFESWVFVDDKAFKIWIWLIGKARHKDGIVSLKCGKGFTTVKLKKGQLLFGRHKAEDELQYDGSLIYRKLKKMEEDNMIKIKSNNQYSIITISKYVDYQDNQESNRTSNEQPSNNQRTPNEQPSNTNNKDNKVNKVNKEENKELENRYMNFIKLFNEITKKNCRGDNASKIQFKNRIKEGYDAKDIKKAITNAYNDTFHKEKNYTYLTPEYICRQTQLEKWINVKADESLKIIGKSPEYSYQ